MNNDWGRGEEEGVAQRNRKVHGYHEGKRWCERGLLLISLRLGPKRQIRHTSDPYKFKGTIDSIDCYDKLQFQHLI